MHKKQILSHFFALFLRAFFGCLGPHFLRGAYIIALCKKIYIYTFFKKALDNGKAPIYNKSNNKISH